MRATGHRWAALCCGCVVNPSARCSANLFPFAHGQFAKWKGGESKRLTTEHQSTSPQPSSSPPSLPHHLLLSWAALGGGRLFAALDRKCFVSAS